MGSITLRQMSSLTGLDSTNQENMLLFVFFFKNGPFPASFSLFLSFQYTVDSKQMFNLYNFLPKTGFEPWTSGIESDHSTN